MFVLNANNLMFNWHSDRSLDGEWKELEFQCDEIDVRNILVFFFFHFFLSAEQLFK